MLPKAPIIARQLEPLRARTSSTSFFLTYLPAIRSVWNSSPRSERSAPRVVIIGMTTSATLNSIIDAMRLGASDYLVKPFRVDELSAVLERAAMTFPRSPVCACYAKACTQPWDLDP